MPLMFEMHPRCSAISPCVDLANVVMRVMCKTCGDFLVDCCNYGFVEKMLPHIPVVYEHVPDSDSVLGRYAIFRHRHLQLCSAPPLFEFE